MILSLIREGDKTIPEVIFAALSPNDNKVLKFGARNLPVDRPEGTNERQRY